MRDLLSLPKANLHVHLEATIRPQTLADIAASHDLQVPPGTRITDSASFFAANNVVRNCLLTFEDYYRVAVEYCADEAAQGTRYAEVSFTAAAHGERLGDMTMPLRAVLDGLAQGRAITVCRPGLFSITRDAGLLSVPGRRCGWRSTMRARG